MKTVDFYIFYRWLEAFLVTLLATLGILLLEDMSDNLFDLIEVSPGALEILRYYLILLPSLLPTVLPISLMISILISLGTLHRKNEIIALRACGFNLFQITRSLWGVGLFFLAILFFLNAQWVSWSVETSRKVLEHYEYQHYLQKKAPEKDLESKQISNLTFSNPKTNRLWFINEFDTATLFARGVTIYKRDQYDRIIVQYTAAEGFFDEYNRHWVLKKGRVVEFDEQSKPVFSMTFDDLETEEYALAIKAANEPSQSETYLSIKQQINDIQKIRQSFTGLTEQPMLMLTFKKSPEDLSLSELKYILQTFASIEDRSLNPYRVRYHQILTTPVICLIIVALGIPFSLSGVRVSPMAGLGKSLGLFFLYFFIASLSAQMGNNGILHPLIAAWLPSILMLTGSVSLYLKAF